MLTNKQAAKEYKWKLNKPEIALMWRGGCIIRSVFLKDITKALVSSGGIPFGIVALIIT